MAWLREDGTFETTATNCTFKAIEWVERRARGARRNRYRLPTLVVFLDKAPNGRSMLFFAGNTVIELGGRCKV